MKTFETIDALQFRYLDFLKKICSYEARAYDKDVINRMSDYITEFAQSQGFTVTRKPMEKCGDFLTVEINPGAEKACLCQAHMDTVHPAGSFGEPPVREDDARIYGPGVIDCKGGIAVSLLAMKALLDNGFQKHMRLILTSDEEVSNILGGEEEIRFIQESAKGFPCALNCETAENDEVVIARKGILKYRLDIKGVGGHAGKHFFNSKNAIVEAAHKILALNGESKEGGSTYSCNIINGGTVSNVIPDSCIVTIDIRAVTVREMEIAKKTVEEIAAKSFLGDTTCQATLVSQRPPMERSANTQQLFERLLATCHKYDLGSLTPMESGGGSDSCYTQAAGIPSICGMGASGRYQHTVKEYLNKDTVALRAKIITAFLLDSES
jgi:glutamate carboxypeptidase